jgi:hypothetical protein
MTMRMDMTVAGRKIALRGSGVADYAQRTSRLVLGMSVPGLGSVRMDGITIGHVVYIRMPRSLMGSKVPAGKTWVRTDLTKTSGQFGGLNALSQTGTSGPSEQLDYLRATGGEVDEVGHDTIRGVSTTHYRANVDLDKVAERAPAGSREQARRSVQQIEAVLGRKTLPLDAWIGDDGLVRRVAESMSFNSGMSMTMKMTIDLYDFGTAVHVQAPPASQVYSTPG